MSCLVFTAPLTLVPLAGGPKPVILAMLFAAEFVSGFGVMALDICLGSIYALPGAERPSRDTTVAIPQYADRATVCDEASFTTVVSRGVWS